MTNYPIKHLPSVTSAVWGHKKISRSLKMDSCHSSQGSLLKAQTGLRDRCIKTSESGCTQGHRRAGRTEMEATHSPVLAVAPEDRKASKRRRATPTGLTGGAKMATQRGGGGGRGGRHTLRLGPESGAEKRHKGRPHSTALQH